MMMTPDTSWGVTQVSVKEPPSSCLPAHQGLRVLPAGEAGGSPSGHVTSPSSLEGRGLSPGDSREASQGTLVVGWSKMSSVAFSQSCPHGWAGEGKEEGSREIGL